MLRVLITLFFFGVYIFCAYPTIAGGDSPELTTAAIVLGIPHAPGFPLYVISGKLFSVILPFGNYGYRLNIFSALLLAISLALFNKLIRELTENFWAALGATFILGVNPIFQSQAQSSEVFALTIFLTVIMLNIAWIKNIPIYSRLLLLSFLFGLSLGNHQIIIVFIPLLIWLLIKSADSKKVPRITIALSFLFFFLGLTIYLIFLIISPRQPIVCFGNPKNLSGILDLFFRRAFGTTQLHPTTLGFRSLSLFANQLLAYYHALWSRFNWAGIILILVGLFFSKDYFLSLILLGSFLLAGPFFTVYTNLSPNSLNLWRLERFWLLADFFLILILAFGLRIILRKFKQSGQIVIVILLITYFFNFTPLFSQRDNFLFLDFARNIIRTAPPETPIIFTTKIFDEPASTIAYLETIKPTRRVLISRGQTILKSIYPKNFSNLSEGQKIFRAIEKEKEIFPSEIYYFAFDPAELPAPVYLNGLLYTFRGKPAIDIFPNFYPLRFNKLYSYPDYLILTHYYYFFAKKYLERNQPNLAEKYFSVATTFGKNMSWLYYNIAAIYLKKENFLLAEKYLELSNNCDPYFAENYFALGYLFYRQKNYPLAEQNFLTAIKIKPDFPQSYYNLMVMANEKKDLVKFNYYRQQYEKLTGEKIWKQE